MWSAYQQQPKADMCVQFADCIGLQAAAIKGSNFVFSPVSIRAALSLAAVGSSSQTLEEFLCFLGSSTVGDLNASAHRLLASVRVAGSEGSATATAGGGSCLSFVNGVWVDRSLTLKPSFKEIATSIYDSAATSVDFQTKPLEAVEEVNAWVQANTNELIKNLIPSDEVDTHTRVILANALYFKVPWAEKFDSSKTMDGEFHLLDGSSIQVPFMTSWKDQYIDSFHGFKVLKLPYKLNQIGRNFSMLFFLPDNQDGLNHLVQKAVSSSIFFDSHVPATRVETGKFMIPKFKISSRFNASKALWDLGLKIPFTKHAEFMEMVLPLQDHPGQGKLYISSVFHKATIEVGEEGTEASAATAVMMKAQCCRPPVNFVADHPFMFAIREEQTGAILFLGHVANPLEVETEI